MLRLARGPENGTPSYGRVVCPVSRLWSPCRNSAENTAPVAAWLLGSVAVTVDVPIGETTTSCCATAVPPSRNTAFTGWFGTVRVAATLSMLSDPDFDADR